MYFFVKCATVHQHKKADEVIRDDSRHNKDVSRGMLNYRSIYVKKRLNLYELQSYLPMAHKWFNYEILELANSCANLLNSELCISRITKNRISWNS